MTKKAVESHYVNLGCSVDFEITGFPPLKGVPEKYLKQEFLQRYKRVLPTPDIIGWVTPGWSSTKERKLVVVEFKMEPVFRDVFQAKGYDELFDADSTLLVSQYPLYDNSRKTFEFLSQNPKLTRTKNGSSWVVFKFLTKTPQGKPLLAQLGTDIGVLPYAAPWEP